MNESQRQYAKQKKTNMKKYILSDLTDISLRIGKNNL